MSGGTESVDAAASTEQGSLKTIWVKLERRRHADVSVLHARLHPAPDPGGPDYAAAFDSLYQVVDEIVARHVVSKLEGGTSGFTLAANTLGGDDRHLEHLLACARELVFAVRDRVRLPCGTPAELSLGLATGDAWSGMLGTSPPHFQLFGAAVEAARSLSEQGVPHHIQATSSVVERLTGAPLKGGKGGGVPLVDAGQVSTAASSGGGSGGGGGTWCYGGWLRLYEGSSQQVYLLSGVGGPPQQALLGELAIRACNDASIAQSSVAQQGLLLQFSDPALEAKYVSQQEARGAALERAAVPAAAAAAAACVWRLPASIGAARWWAVMLLFSCAASAMSISRRSSSRELRWWLVQAALTWLLALALCAGGPTDLLPIAAAAAAAACVNAAVQPVRVTVHATYAAAVVTVAGGLSGLLALQPEAAEDLGCGSLSDGWGTLTAVTAVAGVPVVLCYLLEHQARQIFLLSGREHR
mmetsp:Transcript_20568/g.61910  ORF Transcript_20568/g.61910 Transcript_20568/m.61910 type:complete len:470 (+) Transcript_20568:301-1710(+)|eukprot:CAMPEP_0206146450 /NCGR_PEP_ID=MMETSP1473-20131121/30362_1 /ASSEMBLY_ACC=CAM_ASM_001109 /TAXON_ID=1461547 /ORGANISM="Stichococcus sp, Strain RCC1054" /LENGTH=469 /DNA_ID=CAMNT_0053543007 /DNA_START=236 /DNA_END=1645 /DNA_ORIENTATION=+